MEQERKYTIIVVDDHTLFRNGLRILLDGIDGFAVAGEASNGEELLELLPTNLLISTAARSLMNYLLCHSKAPTKKPAIYSTHHENFSTRSRWDKE